MASSSQLRATSCTPKNPTKDFLLWENKELKRRIKAIEEEMEELKKGKSAQNTNPWRTPSPEEVRFPWETVRRSLEDLVGQVVDGGRKRRVGGLFDPEKEEDRSIPFMVKIGGVM